MFTEWLIESSKYLDWLNRIGIILNCLAGFMMAPDIIGKEKLDHWRIVTEEVAKKGRILMDRIYSKLSIKYWVANYEKLGTLAVPEYFKTQEELIAEDKLPNEVLVYLTPKEIARLVIIFLILSTIFWIIFWWITVPDSIDNQFKIKIIVVVLLPIFFYLLYMVFSYIRDKVYGLINILSFSSNFLYSSLGAISAVFFAAAAICLVFIWGLPLGLIFVVGYFIPLLLDYTLIFTLKRIEGERFTNVFVKLGVIFFIIGNILQLMATFMPEE